MFERLRTKLKGFPSNELLVFLYSAGMLASVLSSFTVGEEQKGVCLVLAFVLALGAVLLTLAECREESEYEEYE